MTSNHVLLICQGQVEVRSRPGPARPGLVQVWFSFNSLELDSEVGRLVYSFDLLEKVRSNIKRCGDLQYLKRENEAQGFNHKIIGINHHVSNLQPIMKWFWIQRFRSIVDGTQSISRCRFGTGSRSENTHRFLLKPLLTSDCTRREARAIISFIVYFYTFHRKPLEF